MSDSIWDLPAFGEPQEDETCDVTVLRDWIDRITSFHNQRPRYMSVIARTLEPYAEGVCVARSLIGLFDLDTATGKALDFTGQWIGLTRFIDIELDIWFTLDKYGLGFDEGKWRTLYEAETGSIELGDTDYRQLLYAKVVANHWDGTIPNATQVWATLFEQSEYEVILQCGYPTHDPYCHGAMHHTQILYGPRFDAVTYALFAGGYMGIKPAGVGIEFMTQYQGEGPDDPNTGIGQPIFAFDADPPEPQDVYPPTTMAGFDLAQWGITVGLKIARPLPPRPEPPPTIRLNWGEIIWGEDNWTASEAPSGNWSELVWGEGRWGG